MPLLLCACAAQATEIFVAPNGNDGAKGTAAQPLHSIQKALDAVAQPGDVVTVLPSVYAEELSLRASGSAERPIIIRAAQNQAAILDGAERVRG